MTELLGRDIISIADLSAPEIRAILDRSLELKRSRGDRTLLPLEGQIIGLVFEKPSTRTRASFESAAMQLGARTIFLRSDELQLKRGEPIKDTARVLGRYVNCLVIRSSDDAGIQEFARYADIPVINALSRLEHPTQILCDMLTIAEAKGRLEGLKFAWIGDGNNVCNSWLLGGALMGMYVKAACPKGYEPDRSILKRSIELSQKSGGSVQLLQEPKQAAKDADVIYTDVWVSMGQEEDSAQRTEAFKGYTVNDQLVEAARGDVVVMHCLPAHRGMEISEEVLEGSKSIVWDQAENKLHGAKGILSMVVP